LAQQTQTPPAPVGGARRHLPVLLLLFLGSGCAALIYEIVWYQLLQLVIGSLRPEEVRENMRKTLQSEKDRLTTQVTQLEASRAGLESSLQSADAMVQRLRTKLEQEIEAQLQAPPAKKPE